MKEDPVKWPAGLHLNAAIFFQESHLSRLLHHTELYEIRTQEKFTTVFAIIPDISIQVITDYNCFENLATLLSLIVQQVRMQISNVCVQIFRHSLKIKCNECKFSRAMNY